MHWLERREPMAHTNKVIDHSTKPAEREFITSDGAFRVFLEEGIAFFNGVIRMTRQAICYTETLKTETFFDGSSYAKIHAINIRMEKIMAWRIKRDRTPTRFSSYGKAPIEQRLHKTINIAFV